MHLNQSMDGWGIVVYYNKIWFSWVFIFSTNFIIINVRYALQLKRFWIEALLLWLFGFPISSPSINFILSFFPQYSEIEHNGCRLFNDIPSGHNSGFKVSLLLKFEVEINACNKRIIRNLVVLYWNLFGLLQPLNSFYHTMEGLSVEDVKYIKESLWHWSVSLNFHILLKLLTS